MYKHLFQPLKIGNKTLRNRIVFGAHTSNLAENGLPTERHVAYYRERAIGGAGMIVMEPMPVHAAAILTRGNFRHSDDAVIPHFRKITEAVHEHGALVLQQLYHVGQHGDADNSYHPNWSPSGLPSYHDSDGSHAMTEAEIEETIDGFVQAARRCYEAGFDGVEVWAAYHSMLDQFWTPWSNRRDDRWGGSLENRTRASREVMTRIRKLCGDDFIIGLSINHEPNVQVALQTDELIEIVERHDRDHLMDYVTCGTGSYFDFYPLMPNFQYPEKLGTELSSALKNHIKNAVVTSESHIRTPDNAEAVLAAGEADLVSIVRGQIADPHLANKARDGRPQDVRGCLSCNQMCWGRRSRDYWISCVVNPSAGRESEWNGDRFDKADTVRKVTVVGGGPAGLEAARVAAERGHTVTLFEASDKLGGQFRLAGLQPRRAQILDLIDWYERQLQQLDVDVQFNSPVDADDVMATEADTVITATGSLPAETGFQKALPHLDPLPGYDPTKVFSIEDVMSKNARLGERIVLFDEAGNWRGCGTAWHLAEAGHQVTLVTPAGMVGAELKRMDSDYPARQALAKHGVRFICDAGITAWSPEGATVLSFLDGSEEQVGADSLVLATTNLAEDSLYRELLDKGSTPINIGDSAASGQAAFAIYAGRKVALEI
ncbi:MAG: FAD-dependent oxidoreductase [Pseudomonadota bacterium]